MFKSFLFTLLFACAGWAAAGELEDILAKHYEALGGEETLAKVKSMKTTGKMVVNNGQIEIPFEMTVKDRKKIRFDSSFQGTNMTQSFDGEKGWQLMPMMGVTEPQDMNEEDIRNIKDQADFLGDLYDWKAKGYKLELEGKEDVEGTEAYKIKVTTEEDDVRTHYLDTEYFIELKSVATRTQMGQEMEVHAYFSDYKPVDGLMVPYAMSIKTPEGVTMVDFQFNNFELNPQIDDKTFAKPEPKPETPEEK